MVCILILWYPSSGKITMFTINWFMKCNIWLCFQIFFKNRTVDEEGYILFVRKNALQVLIPKYGLETTLYLQGEKLKDAPTFTFNEEVWYFTVTYIRM